MTFPIILRIPIGTRARPLASLTQFLTVGKPPPMTARILTVFYWLSVVSSNPTWDSTA